MLIRYNKGVENVYMQHTPHLALTLESLLKGRLRDTSFPFLDGVGPNASMQRLVAVTKDMVTLHIELTCRPQDVIIFIVGGTTYEEARTVSLFNQESTSSGSYAAGTRVLLGGTCVHNSSRYVNFTIYFHHLADVHLHSAS